MHVESDQNIKEVATKTWPPKYFLSHTAYRPEIFYAFTLLPREWWSKALMVHDFTPNQVSDNATDPKQYNQTKGEDE